MPFSGTADVEVTEKQTVYFVGDIAYLLPHVDVVKLIITLCNLEPSPVTS